MESEANEHCSKTEQQKRAWLDRRNVKGRARRSSESDPGTKKVKGNENREEENDKESLRMKK